MKKLLLGALFLIFAQTTFAQSIAFHENFEAPSNGDSVVSAGVPTWHIDTLHYDGTQSYRDSVALGQTATLATIPFSTVGMNYVAISFAHICKIEFFDKAYIEVSSDGGTTWQKVGGSDYLGNSVNYTNSADSAFNSASYPAVWLPGNQTIAPNSSWFQVEKFDLSDYLSNIPNAMVRFRLEDANNTGNNGNYGWVIDAIEVEVNPCELIPPVIGSVNGQSGAVYYNGPYPINSYITDNRSGIGSAYAVYTVNGGPVDSVQLTHIGDSIYNGALPAVNTGDTICYFVRAVDGSTCANSTRVPSNNSICFVFKPAETVPYFTNFDFGSSWTPISAGGSEWELGTPMFGFTNNAYSAPNSWDIDLDNGYVSNTEAILVSPPFDFTGVYNPTISFRMNLNAQLGRDGLKLEYSTDSVTWALLGSENAPNSSDWYNDDNVSALGSAGWTGQTAGWSNPTIKFNNLDNESRVFFRFVFESDFNVNSDGVSIDDFQVKLPGRYDGEVASLINPGVMTPANMVDSVRIRIRNAGLELLDTIPVTYQINGGPLTTVTFYDTLHPGTADNFVVGPYSIMAGPNNFCAWLDVPQDTVPENDTLCLVVNGVPAVSIPYSNNFDVGMNDFWVDTLSDVNTWELGAPIFPVSHSANSAPNCWDIDLDAVYQHGSEGFLETPVFTFSEFPNPVMKFNLWYNTQANWDGMTVQYSTNGITWNTLGVANDPNGENWFTTNNIFSIGEPGWSGNSNGWIPVELKMEDLSFIPAVKFRFVWESSLSIANQGLSIDDFQIVPPPDYDVNVVDVITPTPIGCGYSSAEQVTISLSNEGLKQLDSIPVSYTATGFGTFYDTVFTKINRGDTIHFTFAQTIDLSTPGANTTISASSALATDQNLENDSIFDYFFKNEIVILPYVQNFDTMITGNPGGNLQGWTQSENDLMNWTIHSGNTSSSGTGPTEDHTTGSGNYIYTETSGFNNQTAHFVSPCIDLSTVSGARLDFWFHMLGAAMGDLRVDVQDISNSTPWTTVKLISGEQGPDWQKTTVDLSAYVGSLIKIRFNALTGASFTSDMAVDDVYIYEPEPFDAGVVDFISPNPNPDCGYTGSDTIGIRVVNLGYQSVDTIPVAYSINGLPVVVDTVFEALAPFDTAVFYFQATDLTIANTLNVTAYTTLQDDTVYYDNDTATTTLYNTLFKSPYFQDFETFGLGNPGELNGGWKQSTTDNMDWTVHTGNTTSTNTGPSGDHTTGSGIYLYTEASGWNNRTADLISPCLDLSGLSCPKLEFYYHMFGANMGDLMVQVDSGNGVWDTVWTVSGNRGNVWHKASANLANYVGKTIRVRLRGLTGPGFTSDIAIDDFTFVDSPPTDALAVGMARPGGNTGENLPVKPKLIFVNNGCTTINTIDLGYSVNGAAPVIETLNQIIEPADTIEYEFITGYNSPLGNYSFCSWVDLVGDTVPQNDTVCKTVIGLPVYDIAHCDDFEGIVDGWIAKGSWEKGVPNNTIINSAAGGTEAFVTDLNGDYLANASDTLISPLFNFGGLLRNTIEFDLHLEAAFGDGLRVEYTYDGGLNWHILGEANSKDTSAVNWYNEDFLSSSGTPGWTGTFTDWEKVVYPLDTLDSISDPIQFMFIFSSTGFGNAEGAGIDNFCINSPPQTSLSVQNIIIDNNTLNFPGLNPVTAKIRNTGVRIVEDFLVELNVDGGAFVITDTVNLATPMYPGDRYTHIFSQQWLAMEGVHNVCAKTLEPNFGIDNIPTDDERCEETVIIDSVNTFGYCNDFEGSQPAWVSADALTYKVEASHWELGLPAQTHINAAFSGFNAWMTRLNTNYGQRDSSALFSPLFYIDTAKCYQLNFQHAFKTEPNNDGGSVMYSQDKGVTWKLLGSAYEPNWYNTIWITGIPGVPHNAGWSGQSEGWQYASHLIKFDSDEPVLFRFRFGSDMSVFDEGWAIDDFCFEEYAGACIISVDEELFTGISEAMPNPAAEATRFEISLAEPTEVLVNVHNSMGQHVFTKNLDLGMGQTDLNLDVSDFPAGLYYISFQVGDQVVNKSFSVQR